MIPKPAKPISNGSTGQRILLPAALCHLGRDHWSPGTESYALAKGKYAAVCEATCATKMDEYLAEHAKILQLPTGKD